jgi:hypothetical protein
MQNTTVDLPGSTSDVIHHKTETTTIFDSLGESVDSSNANTSIIDANSKTAREIRLEQNRRAAHESRKRKRVLFEELQRSVIFFSRANDKLKQQNDQLTRLLLQAQHQVEGSDGTRGESTKIDIDDIESSDCKSKACLPVVVPTTDKMSHSIPKLQLTETGATIQAMTNFQQAVSAAMQSALTHMKQYGINNDNNIVESTLQIMDESNVTSTTIN